MSQSAVGAAGIIKFGDDNNEICASCKCIGAVQHKGVKCPLFKFVPTYYLDHGEFCVMMPSVNVTTVIQPVTDSSAVVVEGVEDEFRDSFIGLSILMAIHYGHNVPSDVMSMLTAPSDHVVSSDVMSMLTTPSDHIKSSDMMPLLQAQSGSIISSDVKPMLAAPVDHVISSDVKPMLAVPSDHVVSSDVMPLLPAHSGPVIFSGVETGSV